MKHCPICGGRLSKVTTTRGKTWERNKHLKTHCENEWMKHKNNILFILPKPPAQDWEYISSLTRSHYKEFEISEDIFHETMTIPAGER